jgi:molybdate transport system ATP-binding protein
MPAAEDVLLELSDVSFAYRALPVLSDLNWRWQTSEQWACLGANGAGKTTLAGILCGQLRHASGDYRPGPGLDGGGVAYVCFEQQKTLCDRDRHLDDSEFRADAHDPGTAVRQAIIGDRTPDDNFLQWTARLGMSHILERGIRFISTGEMRKTLLLRAILQQPRLLILDSPLDGLDRASQSEMAQLLQELLDSPLRILLLCRDLRDLPVGVSHLLALEGGRIIASGPRQRVLDDPAVKVAMAPPDTPLGPLPPPAERSYRLDKGVPLVELRDVAVSYGAVEVLRDVNWTLMPGQHCCISGPNGCGKTTLLSLINGDNHKAYGQDITLFGIRRGSGESVWEIKQKYGLLSTDLHLNHVRGMRVIEVVVSGFFDTIGLYDDWGDQQREVAESWLATLGLEAFARLSFDTLSFGLQRMVLLARAMVKSPVILVLDEPCLGLDGHNRRTILRAIDHIAANSDTQLLYVSHSAGDMPGCINQHLEFIPREDGFDLRCSGT